MLAIAGFFPFAGFFSKDAILYAAFQQGAIGKVLWFVGLVTALLHVVLHVPALVPDILRRVAQSTTFIRTRARGPCSGRW